MSAIDFDTIKDTIYSWIASRGLVDNQKIYEEDPNVDRPYPPSISYRMLTLPVKNGTTDNTSYSGSGDVMTISGDRLMTVSIKVYGDGASQLISDLCESLELFSVQQVFQSANIAVRNINAPQEISQEIETGIEERYNMDIIFGVTSIQSEDQGAIETVSIVNAKVKDVTGTEVQTLNDTIVKP